MDMDMDMDIIIPRDGLIKLVKLVNLWPKSSVSIYRDNGICVEIVDMQQTVRERPVHVDCVFQVGVNDYIIEPPPMEYNCIVNSRNLKQMIDFCTSVDGVYLEIIGGALHVSSADLSVTTSVQLETIVKIPRGKIKLSTEANSLIIAFLEKIIRFNTVYLLFIERDTAFSIRVNFDEGVVFQIYVVHGCGISPI